MAADPKFTGPGAPDFPRPGPDTEAEPGERRANAPATPAADQRTGSQPEMIGGGGSAKSGKKRTTKKY
jgi:hypothetical protein